tara:strand:+ start:772 stop:915 length:144 start_codon:yes stop_codon:yes gene_type:complete
MIKTILIIVTSVALIGLIFFIIVKNKLKKKLDELVENEKKSNSNNFD